MKKIIIILSSVIIVLGAVLFGGYFYNTKPSDSLEIRDFSFKVPSGFKCTDIGDPDDTNQIMHFECLGEDITIFHFDRNLTPEAFSHFMYPHEDKYAKVKKLKGCPYDCYFYSSEATYEDENGIEISCIIGTDTHFLDITCFCSSLKAKIIMPAIKKIAETVNYTSDFRISDKPDVYDYDYLSVNAGSKYICYVPEDKTDKDYIFALDERYAESDNPDKWPYPSLFIKVLGNGSSPADLADEKYNNVLEEINHNALTRDQKELFGFKCEHIYNENGRKKTRCNDYYYFSNGKYTYYINVKYTPNADEADIKEMLDGITIKNK